MDVFTSCYCFPVSLRETEVYVFELPNLTIFESSISYPWITFQSPWWNWNVDLWCHVVTCLTQPFWSLRSVWFWDIFWLLRSNGYFWLSVMLQLPIESYCGHDFLWMLAHGDLMLLLCIFDVLIMDYLLIFLSSLLYRTGVIYDPMSLG